MAEGPDLVVHQPEETLALMEPIVVDMHTKSGLLDAIRTSTVTLEQAGAETLAFIKQHVPEARKVPLCGNSIGMDRRFLDQHLPDIEHWLHYRSIDVSSVKELVRRWYPRPEQGPAVQGRHAPGARRHPRERRELRFYRERVFVPSTNGVAIAAAAAAEAAANGSAPRPISPCPDRVVSRRPRQLTSPPVTTDHRLRTTTTTNSAVDSGNSTIAHGAKRPARRPSTASWATVASANQHDASHPPATELTHAADAERRPPRRRVGTDGHALGPPLDHRPRAGRVHAERRAVASADEQLAPLEPSSQRDVFEDRATHLGRRVAADGVVPIAPAAEHRTEGDSASAPRAQRTVNAPLPISATTLNIMLRCSTAVARAAAGFVPRLHRHERLGFDDQHRGDAIEQVASGRDVGIDEHHDLRP